MMRLIYRLLVILLGLLGFAGCSETAPMYGQPRATYRLDGRVTTADEKQPIVGIEVYFIFGSHTVTNTGGLWQIDGEGSRLWPNPCSLYVRDVDGDGNGGKFQDKKVPLTLTKTANGNGKWDDGTYEQHDIQIELDRDSTE